MLQSTAYISAKDISYRGKVKVVLSTNRQGSRKETGRVAQLSLRGVTLAKLPCLILCGAVVRCRAGGPCADRHDRKVHGPHRPPSQDKVRTWQGRLIIVSLRLSGHGRLRNTYSNASLSAVVGSGVVRQAPRLRDLIAQALH